jgi:hypothetical protein
MIPAADVELARAVPLVYVIEARGLRLRRQGAELCGPCPVCAAGHDRFSVNTRKSLWLCRHRGRGGNDAVSLVRFLDGCTFAVAVATLAGTAAVTATTPKGAPRPQKDHAGTYACQQARKAGWLWGQRHAIVGRGAALVRRCCRTVPRSPAESCRTPSLRL